MSSDDRSLVMRVRDEGDRAAFDELMEKYDSKIFQHLCRIVSHVPNVIEVAQDLTQGTWLKIYLNIGTFREEQSFLPWACTIGRHHTLDYLRSQRRAPETTLDDPDRPELEFSSPWASPERAAIETQLAAQLGVAVANIVPEDLRQAFYDFHLENRTSPELAKERGVSDSSFRVLMQRLRLRIREELRRLGVTKS